MDSGNGGSGNPAAPVTFQYHIRLPLELAVLVSLYQKRTKMVSRSEAFRRLLETHPELLRLYAEVVESEVRKPAAI